MRTVQFRKVLEGVAVLMGLDPQTADLSPKKARTYAEFITTRCAKGWEWDFWPELCPTEQRQYRDTWLVGEPYVIGNEVYLNEVYYVSIQAGTGQDPETASSAYWEVQTELDKYIPYEQTGKTDIREVDTISARNPRTAQYPGFYDFDMNDNGVQVSLLAGVQVWIAFRPPAPEFTSEVWVITQQYEVDELTYHPPSGECYKCLVLDTGTTPGTDAAVWKKIDFPEILSTWTKYAAYSDALRKDGQQDKAIGEEYRAMANLEEKHDVIFVQNKKVKRAGVRI